MSDLYAALHAAITSRLEVARAATPGPWSGDPTGTVCADADLVDDGAGGQLLPEHGPMEVAECYRQERRDERAANAQHIALHDPADAIRRYERDLKVLKRHKPIKIGSESLCYYEWENDDGGAVSWAGCAEIADLLDVYPEVKRDA